MKQAYLLAILSALIGWLVGDMLRPLEAQRVTPVLTERVIKKAKKVGAGTIEVAADIHDRDKDLPPEVIDARTRGQAARMKALKEAIGKIGPKEGSWGVGGPLIPMHEFTGRPRPRPIIVRAFKVTPSTFEMVPFPDPLAPGGFWFGPGDPSIPPHRSWLDLYPVFTGTPAPPGNPPLDNPPSDNPPADNPPDDPPSDNPPIDNPPSDNPPPDGPPDNPPPYNPPPTDFPPPDIPPPDNPPPVFPPPDGPPTSPIPEPGAWGLMIVGFAALGWALRRRARPQAKPERRGR